MPHRYQSKTDVAERLLIQMIDRGELAAGEKLNQRRLAARIGISATPVREAIRRLATAGLVTHSTRRSPRVAKPPDPHDPDVVLVRLALEDIGMMLAAQRVNETDLAELRRLNALLATDLGVDWGRIHRQFHLRVFEAAKSPILLTQIRVLWASLERGGVLSRTTQASTSAHDAIIDALASRDEARARHLMATHREGGDPAR